MPSFSRMPSSLSRRRPARCSGSATRDSESDRLGLGPYGDSELRVSALGWAALVAVIAASADSDVTASQ